MSIKALIKRNTYLDSITLMSISNDANQIEGVKQAMIGMGTEMNKEVIRDVGLITAEIEEAKTGDLIIVIETEDENELDHALDEVQQLLTKKDKKKESDVVFHTIHEAASNLENANLAVISVGGEFAVREARKALDENLHVMLFSDNISIEDEIELKNLAHEKGLLMMGPDCGTAIINNVGLSFANKVRKGNIGIIGASGTGSQEMSVRIHEFGSGVSQLIGTGGRDLSDEVGGIMMIDALHALEEDEETDVIVLVSKPPAKNTEAKVLSVVKEISKPVVIWFLGGDEAAITKANAHYAKYSKEAAIKAVVLAGANEDELNKRALNLPLIKEVQEKITDEQKYIRGLFSGGTLCDEAMFATMEKYPNVYSNIHPEASHQLEDVNTSKEHTFIDFGSDEFTQGKPHPMIDPSTRIERFLQEARDPEVGVIVLDFVIGYGAHEDPVGVMLSAIYEAKDNAKKEGRHLEILGYVLGTELDEQNLAIQIQKLEEAGVTISSSSQNTGLLAREFVAKGEK